MMELRQQDDTSKRAFSIVHGAIGGLVGVIAAAVWAVNFEAIITGDTTGGLPGFIGRILLCEAIPLATLCAIHAGIGGNQSTESTLKQLLRKIYFVCGGFLVQRQFEDEVSL